MLYDVTFQLYGCSLFFKQEMELSLIGLQNAGKTSLVNVVAVSKHIRALLLFIFSCLKYVHLPVWFCVLLGFHL